MASLRSLKSFTLQTPRFYEPMGTANPTASIGQKFDGAEQAKWSAFFPRR
jgi:hypothetical protein